MSAMRGLLLLASATAFAWADEDITVEDEADHAAKEDKAEPPVVSCHNDIIDIIAELDNCCC